MALGRGTGARRAGPHHVSRAHNFGATSSLCWGELAMVPKARHPFLPSHTSSSIHSSVLAMMMGLGSWGSSMQGPGSPKSRARHLALAHSMVAWPHTQLLHHPRKQKYFSCCCSSFFGPCDRTSTSHSKPRLCQNMALLRVSTP